MQHRTKPSWQQTKPSFRLLSEPPSYPPPAQPTTTSGNGNGVGPSLARGAGPPPLTGSTLPPPATGNGRHLATCSIPTQNIHDQPKLNIDLAGHEWLGINAYNIDHLISTH